MSCPCCNNEMPEYKQEDYWGPVPEVCIPCLDLHGGEIWPHAHGDGWRRYDPDHEAKVEGSEYRWFDRNGRTYEGVNAFRLCQTRVSLEVSNG